MLRPRSWPSRPCRSPRPPSAGAQTPAEPPRPSSSEPTASTDADQAPPTPPDKSRHLLSPQQTGRQGLVKGVAEQPFRDFNLLQSRIPAILQNAMSDPYRRASAPTCDALAEEIRRLDGALGPDLDEPVSINHPSLLIRGGGSARDYGYDALRAGVQTYIPFDNYVRLVSGANRHDAHVLAAIQAGAIWRAYLKRLGEVRGGPSPAIPRHLAHPVTVASDEDTKSR